MSNPFIDEEKIHRTLKCSANPSRDLVSELLLKGRELKGLSPGEAAILLNCNDKEIVEDIFDAAADVKSAIYGDRLVFFAPLYLNSHCINDCDYCGFRVSNRSPRKKLTRDEVMEQVACLIDMGHKRLLLEFGEDPKTNPIDYVVETIETIYSVKRAKGEIRRVNVNIAATTVEDYRLLKDSDIGTYQLFQESYHRPTYEKLHRGPKADFERQLSAMDRAYEAGLDDLGLGVLFGLYDWRFEVLGLIAHADYMQKRFGFGPHTISVPRLRPYVGSSFSPDYPVSNEDFLKLIAILRIAVPYTGMIITTRERAEIREKAFSIGISQTSAASRTSPGSFGKGEGLATEQFELSDRRTLDEIALGVMKQGYTPSFCTACYRKKRTGSAFMDLAMPGDIGDFCQPNSILTLMEYLEDHASSEGRRIGIDILENSLKEIKDPAIKRHTETRLERIRGGERDLYF